MHRVVAGCNLWAVIFLAGALVLAWVGSPWHAPAGLFAAVFALLSQSAIFALFMGASKLLQEHVRLFALPVALVDRTNAIMFPLFRWASIGSLTVLLVAILGGLGLSGDVPAWLQVPAGFLAIAVLLVALPREVRLLRAMHGVLLEMEAALPAAGGRREPAADERGLRSGRALAYVGSTVLCMVLGYRYISGLPVPEVAVWGLGGLAVLCLIAAGALRLRGRRA